MLFTLDFRKKASMELAEQLKKHRAHAGLSQEDVANQIYISRQTLSNWETGNTDPDVQSLLLLSNLFDVSIDELVKGDLMTMNEKVSNDSKTLKHCSWAMVVFLVLMLVAGMIAIIVRDIGPLFDDNIRIGTAISLLFAGGFFLCAFAAAVWAEVIKRQNNLVTYTEILAFEKGIPADEARNNDAFSRKHPIISILFKLCTGAIFGIIATVVFIVIAKYIRDLIFFMLG